MLTQLFELSVIVGKEDGEISKDEYNPVCERERKREREKIEMCVCV